MANNNPVDNKRLVRIYIGELADRAIRFHLHLDAVEAEFYKVSPGLAADAIPRDKPLFLESFRKCVWKVLEAAVGLVKASEGDLSDAQRDARMKIAWHAFLCLDHLHEEGLIHLPRPSEPVEVRRFCRLISRHVLRSESADLAVYTTEATPEGAFAADPLSRLRSEDFSNLAEMVNALSGAAALVPPAIEGRSAIHVTIARIDARNPVRWPSLFHEAAHKLLTLEVTGGKSLDKQFSEWAPPEVGQELEALKMNLAAWLTEVWCDLFAALVMGPSFFFSQFSAFVSAPPNDCDLNPNYPPHSFRLRLVNMFLRHHHGLAKRDPLCLHMKECLEVVEYWDRLQQLDLETNHALKVAFDAMRGFFQEHFFCGSGTEVENFQSKFESMVRYVRSIDRDSLLRMQSELANGLPVASKPSGKQKALAEEPTSVQEVLLAAWLDRLDRVREAALMALTAEVPLDWARLLKEKVFPTIERFDDAVLRSLQLAEWLHLLGPSSPRQVVTPRGDLVALRNSPPGLLNDRQIVELLSAGELRVMPLIDLDQQLGSTSLDIRLGTSFEVYLPACRRTPEAAQMFVESYDSRLIDLDYLEHVVLLPGQSMLGHSFEYLKLPNWVAAELDGRSSYARLGLEVHMTAGMIDPGFQGALTFELLNSGPNPIQLFPGLRIAQLRFISLDEPCRPYSDRHAAKYRGLLQHKTSLYMNDPDFKRIHGAIQELEARRLDEAVRTEQTVLAANPGIPST